MATTDMNKTAHSRDPRGNLNDDHERSNGDHPRAAVDQQRDASVEKNDVKARPISQSSEPPLSKSKTRPPSPGKRLFKGKFILPIPTTFAIAYSAQTETNRVFGVFIAQSHTSTSFSSNSNSNHSSSLSDPYSGAGADDFDPITGTYGRKIRLGGDDEDRVCILQQLGQFSTDLGVEFEVVDIKI